jgi:hypothetical protein
VQIAKLDVRRYCVVYTRSDHDGVGYNRIMQVLILKSCGGGAYHSIIIQGASMFVNNASSGIFLRIGADGASCRAFLA